jgi:hypothetical protein
MPNHVTTRCTVTGPEADVEKFRADLFVADDPKALFDFNKIIPMPDCLRDTESGTMSEHGAQLIIARAEDRHTFFGNNSGLSDAHWQRITDEVGDGHAGAVAARYLGAHPEFEAKGMACLRAIVETGFASWYPWATANWSTKWNSYSVQVIDAEPGRFQFKFDTAWSTPDPVLHALAEKYPTLTFDLLSYDEGGNFACRGQLGAVVTEPFAEVEATDELFEAVYGHPPEHEEEDA